MVNPGSVILSGVMMLDYIGWNEAGKQILDAFERPSHKEKLPMILNGRCLTRRN